MAQANIIDLLESLRGQVEEAYQRGLAAGRIMEREAMMAYLTVDSPVPSPQPAAANEAALGASVDLKRTKAPRGLVAEVVAAVLRDYESLALPQLEEEILRRDPRIARKSIYNHLNSNRGTLYTYGSGKWGLPQPAEKPSPVVDAPARRETWGSAGWQPVRS